MSFTGPLEDRIAIRELHDSYADAGFRGNKQAWLDCWAEDGVWVSPFGEFRGKQQLSAQWDGLWATFGTLAFFAVVGAIEIDGERAASRGYIREIMVPKQGATVKVVGRYDDELLREGGAWRFARRSYSMLIREDFAPIPA